MNLHLGSGIEHRIKGFINLDIQKYKNTDRVCDIRELPYKDNSINKIYASHCLEHFGHTETGNVLKEWYRVLKKDGILYIGVPDFDAVIKLYKKINMLSDFLIRLLYGDQDDKTDKFCTHYTVFNYSNLLFLLNKAGFIKMERVNYFPFKLRDCSTIRDTFYNISLSINVIAYK